MRNIGLMAGGAVVALALAACHPPHPHARILKVISSLDCPETQGDLERKSVAADGKSCAYATDAGDQVTLQLISLDGKTPGDVLAPIEAQLKTEAPAAVTPPTPPAPPGAPPPPGGKDNDRVDIDLPGIHIHGSGNGHADVDTAGVHVEAHDHDGHSGDHAEVRVGGGPFGNRVTVNAAEGGAQIRLDEPGSGVRADLILASDIPGPHGFKTAGYVARGPKTGPIAVAVILTKSDDSDDVRHEVRQLLRRNVGD